MLLCPEVLVNSEQLFSSLLTHIQALHVQTTSRWNVADGSRLGNLVISRISPVKDPLKDTNVLAKTGPQEPTLLALSEPVDVEDLGHGAFRVLQAQPVLQIVAKVVAKEWTHGEWIVHDNFAPVLSGSSRF